jgi:hypothetical protein
MYSVSHRFSCSIVSPVSSSVMMYFDPIFHSTEKPKNFDIVSCVVSYTRDNSLVNKLKQLQ